MDICKLNAGMLRTRIELQSVDRVTDGAGGFTNTWTTHATVGSYWQSLSMTERLHAMQVQASVGHRVYIRYRAVSPVDRIYYNSQAYQIRGVVDIDNRHLWLELLVEEGVAAV